MFTCPNCNQKTDKLIGTTDCVKCPSCNVHVSVSSPTYFHTKAGLSDHAKNLTIAQKRHILDRTVLGNKVVCRSNPSRVWSW